MLGQHLLSPVTQKRLRSGPAADHIDHFADWLHGRGYRPRSLEDLLRALAGWTDWMASAGFTAADILRARAVYQTRLATTRRVRYARGINRQSIVAASLYIQFLRAQGVISALPVPAPPSARWPMLGRFRSWMRQHRGLTESTLDVYQRILIDLCERLGDDPGQYTADALRAFVFERARPHGVERAKSIAVAVRALLRFLTATGASPTGFEDAIPHFASWQLSSVPRCLHADDVERLIQSCGTDATGLRDRAVLLVLARLGLRASEVAGLVAPDLDWENGRLAVCGKGRRREWLPLPQEVGLAILRYQRQGRPPLTTAHVFATAVAPVGPLTRAIVAHIVRSALGRTGIQAPTQGAHLLRHSAATAMLQHGATLASVAAVLRHRSTRMTMHYAKVDVALLAGVAQPWPEDLSC